MPDSIFPYPLPYTLQPDDQLYFLHIAKTAGRSFEDFLKKFFPAEQTTRIDVEHGYPADIPENVFRDYRLYLGHLGYYFVSLFPENKKPYWLTMLRDPVERVISFYYFFRNIQPIKQDHINYRHQVLASTLSLLEFVQSEETAELVDNYQFHTLVDSEMIYFNNVTGINYHRSIDSSTELISLVKHRLQNECIFFGITERYDTSLALLCYTLNWDLPTQALEKLNVTPNKPHYDEIDQKTIDAIKEKNQFDIEIYEFASALFEKRVGVAFNHLLQDRKNIASSTRDLIVSTANQQNLASDTNPPPEIQGTTTYGKIKNVLKNSPFYPMLRTAKNDLLKIQLKAVRLSSVFKSSPSQAVIHEAESDLKGKENEDTLQQVSTSPVQPVAMVDFPTLQSLESNSHSKKQLLDARLCFHIPASPNDAFFSQIAMFRLGLNSLGGVYEKADIVVTLGDSTICPLPERWRPHLTKNVRLEWVEPTDFLRQSYDAQSDAQWRYDNRDYDLVCFMDADVMIMRPIDELLSSVFKNPVVAGTIAHYAPPVPEGENPQQWWLALAHEFLGKPIPFGYRYTLVEGQSPEYTFCPFYINFGVVLLTPDLVNLIRETHLDLRPKVARKLAHPYFAAQTSLALTLAAHDIPVLPMGMRYNFPNDRVADHLQLNELRDVRIIHYLRTEYFDRQKIFTTEEEFDHFLSLKLSGSNKIFQDFIQNLTGGHYPF